MTPVFIPSKGRAKTCKTNKLFKEEENIFIVVEPQDEESYRNEGLNNLLVLPKNNQGIVYVRNWILDYASNKPCFWVMDDDISNFLEYDSGKGKKISGEEACAKAQKILQMNVPRLGQGSMEYSQFAWSAKKEFSLLGYCDVAVLIFPSLLGKIRYRPFFKLKEDRDFTLQVVAAGMLTARASRIAFVTPKNGSNAGGLSELYAKRDCELGYSKRMIAEWPGICELNIKPDGRPDVKIQWKKAYGTRRPAS